MARPSRSRGPYQDPRLLERQGDLMGPSAFVLVFLMVCGVALVGVLLVGVGRVLPGSGTVGPASPGPSAVAAPPTASRSPTRSILPAVPTPSAGVSTPSGTSSSPGPSPLPGVSPAPGTSPASSPVTGRQPVEVGRGRAAPVTEGDSVLGDVTVGSARYQVRSAGTKAPAGSRWLVVSMTYQATDRMRYDGRRWRTVDADGEPHPWTSAPAPRPELGKGTLDAGESRTGYLAFEVPADIDIRHLVLTDKAGDDIVTVAIR